MQHSLSEAGEVLASWASDYDVILGQVHSLEGRVSCDSPGSRDHPFGGMSSSLLLTPLASLRVSRHQIPAFKSIPNTSIQDQPLLIYHSAFRNANAADIETHLSSTGVVQPHWRFTMYSDTHFHSTTHEVLSIASGSAKCCFGGEENPGRVETILQRGDVVVIPAGVGHRLLEDYGGFQMVGSYPVGKDWDMCYGRPGEEEKVRSIATLGWFQRDPIYGDAGPTLK